MFVSVLDQQPHTAEELGGKGYGLWFLQNQGIKVPPALIIPTELCVAYMAKPKAVMKDIEKNLWRIHEFFHQQFGYQPLLSVRSGARVSMPGMMDTVLNVGLTYQSMAGWFERLPESCVTDSFLRLIEMYGSVVMGIDRQELTRSLTVDSRLAKYKELTGEEFPNAKDQLLAAIEAVFKSWNNDRAKVYRQLNKIPDKWGTAVVIQAMVFGNMNDNSGTGVLFTRNPDTGEAKLTGEFLINAQGEDVVAGIRTPMPLSEISNWNDDIGQQLQSIGLKLEDLTKEVQDIEFTVQDGTLYILQTRKAKRSARASVRFALDMLDEGMIDKTEVPKRVSLKEYALAQQAVIDPSFKKEPAFVGISACSGVAKGVIVRSKERAINCKDACVLVTQETTPDDIAGMIVAKGILTMTGGATSHAAVVARGMNKPCIVGLGQLLNAFPEGATITIDGSSGRIWLEDVPVIDGDTSETIEKFEQLMYEVAQVKPIASEYAAPEMLLDLTDMLIWEPQKLLAHVASVVKKCKKVIIDVRHTPLASEFYSMFVQPAALATSIGSLLEMLSTEDRKKIRVITPTIKSNLPQIRQVITLEDLVLANGDYMFEGGMSPAMTKVMEWKQAEGSKPMVIGEAADGQASYMSRSQLAHMLLS